MYECVEERRRYLADSPKGRFYRRIFCPKSPYFPSFFLRFVFNFQIFYSLPPKYWNAKCSRFLPSVKENKKSKVWKCFLFFPVFLGKKKGKSGEQKCSVWTALRRLSTYMLRGRTSPTHERRYKEKGKRQKCAKPSVLYASRVTTTSIFTQARWTPMGPQRLPSPVHIETASFTWNTMMTNRAESISQATPLAGLAGGDQAHSLR